MDVQDRAQFVQSIPIVINDSVIPVAVGDAMRNARGVRERPGIVEAFGESYLINNQPDGHRGQV